MRAGEPGTGRAPLPPAGVVVNFIAFQLVWLLSLYGAGSGRPWLGGAALAVFLAWHLRAAASPRAELALAAAAAVTGLVADSLFARIPVLGYAAPWPFPGWAPAWIVAMWVNFALTLNVSLRWLQGRLMLAALLGLVGGPLAYLAGLRLGAAQLLAPPEIAYGVIGGIWALAVPALVALAPVFAQRWPEGDSGPAPQVRQAGR